MRVLFLSSVNNFVLQIASALKERNNVFEASIPYDQNILEKHKAIFENIIVPKISFCSILFFVRRFPIFCLFFFKSIGILLADFKQGLKSIKCLWDAFLYLAKIQHAQVSRFDVVNVHYCNIVKAIITLLLPKDQKIVISFWGTDLLRTNGFAYNFWLRKATKKASKIHVSSIEMRESLLNEFGHALKEKVNIAMFLPDYSMVERLLKASAMDEQVCDLQKQYKISEGRCIMIGNNGNIGNNHIKILNAIAPLVKEKDITIFLPLTYSLSEKYEYELESLVKKLGIRVVWFKKYLSVNELAVLRTLTDIYITMQETDAMSAFLTEAMCAGNICITAAWLPYSQFRKSGAYYLECSEFSDLERILSTVMQDFEKYKKKCEGNSKLISETFYNKEVLESAWEKLFN